MKTLAKTTFNLISSLLTLLCMDRHLHYAERENVEAKDWRPWVILGLLAVVITLALLSY